VSLQEFRAGIALGRGQVHRTVEDHEIGRLEVRGQPIRLHQPFVCSHADFLSSFRL
jgi:hypothetical protein